MSLSIGKTDVGLVRKNNEDAFFVDDNAGYCALADGMGGAAAGEVASGIFIDMVRELFGQLVSEGPEERYGLVQKAFILANQRILENVRENPSRKGMGCTAELLVYTPGGFVLGHMGDSRTYRYRSGELKQISRDHSLVQEQIEQGIITPQEARVHPMRNVILRAVGTSENPALDIVRGKTQPGDLFLLCSDGLTDMIDDPEIVSVLSSSGDLDALTDELISRAKKAGGKDNVTVVLSKADRS